MSAKKKYVQDELSYSESSSDDENLFNKKEFNDKELSKMAKHLLEDWTFILKKLDVTLVEIKHIENLHPREMRRQALEGLTMWHKKSSTLLKDLLNVFRNNERQDMIELFEEMQDSTKKTVRRKRSLPRSYYRRSKKKRRTNHTQQSSTFLSIYEEKKPVTDTDMNLQSDSEPSVH